jgi:hypothetical protein
MPDESTYGFSKADAAELIQVIGAENNEYREGRNRPSPCLYAKTKSGGISVGTPAAVLLYDESGTITARELIAETRVSAIPADTEVILISAYGRWLALKVC